MSIPAGSLLRVRPAVHGTSDAARSGLPALTMIARAGMSSTRSDTAVARLERARRAGSLEIPEESRALVVGAEHRVRTGDLRLGKA